MFLVLNKEKIAAYVVSILTVCCLFFIASDLPEKENTKATSTNVQEEKNTNNTQNMNNTVITGNNIKQ